MTLNARSQAELGRRLEAALAREGIAVEQAMFRSGNVGYYEPVSGEALIMAWTARLWRVQSVDPTDVPVIDIGRGR